MLLWVYDIMVYDSVGIGQSVQNEGSIMSKI